MYRVERLGVKLSIRLACSDAEFWDERSQTETAFAGNVNTSWGISRGFMCLRTRQMLTGHWVTAHHHAYDNERVMSGPCQPVFVGELVQNVPASVYQSDISNPTELQSWNLTAYGKLAMKSRIASGRASSRGIFVFNTTAQADCLCMTAAGMLGTPVYVCLFTRNLDHTKDFR